MCHSTVSNARLQQNPLRTRLIYPQRLLLIHDLKVREVFVYQNHVLAPQKVVLAIRDPVQKGTISDGMTKSCFLAVEALRLLNLSLQNKLNQHKFLVNACRFLLMNNEYPMVEEEYSLQVEGYYHEFLKVQTPLACPNIPNHLDILTIIYSPLGTNLKEGHSRSNLCAHIL